MFYLLRYCSCLFRCSGSHSSFWHWRHCTTLQRCSLNGSHLQSLCLLATVMCHPSFNVLCGRVANRMRSPRSRTFSAKSHNPRQVLPPVTLPYIDVSSSLYPSFIAFAFIDSGTINKLTQLMGFRLCSSIHPLAPLATPWASSGSQTSHPRVDEGLSSHSCKT